VTAPERIASIELLLDGRAHGPTFITPRGGDGADVRFWAPTPGLSLTAGEAVGVGVRARLADGGTATAELGRIECEEEPTVSPAHPEAPGEGLIAVCLATFEPDMERLRRQLDSLRAQSDRNWVCLVSDDCSDPARYAEIEADLKGDERFAVSRSDRRRGFYLNFERALRLAPAEAGFVALCDQDDVWYPDKLSTLRRAIGKAPLAYSDARLVDTAGDVVDHSLWPKRRPNTRSLGSVLVANSVPGASALIRADLARRALPFPRVPGWPFHDRWLPAVARSAGPIVRVKQPLYDYVQHEGAVLGGRFISGLRERGTDLTPSLAARWRGRFFYVYVPLRMYALALLDRDAVHDAAERRALRRVTAETFVTALRLSLRSLRTLVGRDETSGLEWIAASGLIWRLLAGFRSRSGGGRSDTAPPPLNLADVGPPRWG
jgi:glycosyltransferase involved in cell wall biosynthesis